eukprot:Hpha_TRINITY_DN15813_c1_g1::TRINITY_DN15813_c1_g1_i1::g.189336::m.189336
MTVSGDAVAAQQLGAHDYSDLLNEAVREAQGVWLMLTSEANEPDSVFFSNDDLCAFSHSAQGPPLRQEPVAENGSGVLARLLAAAEQATVQVEEVQRAPAKGAGTYAAPGQDGHEAIGAGAGNWTQRAALRREQYMQNVKQGRGYNLSMMAVQICKGPEDSGLGFPAGRGRPLGPA